MARECNGTTSKAQATITAVNTESWTIGAVFNPDTLGEGSAGRPFSTDSGGSSRQFMGLVTNQRIEATQARATTPATSRSNNDGIVLDVWQLVVATFDVADSLVRLYRGTLDAAVAALGLGTQSAGSGARSTGGSVAVIGAHSGGTQTFDGPISRVFFDARLWSLAEMEAFRLGVEPIQSGTLRGYWPLNSPTASQAEDLSGNGAHATVTSMTVAEDPPLGGGGVMIAA